MIAKVCRGAVRVGDGAAYASYIQQIGINGCKGTPGNRGAWVLSRAGGDRAEFITPCFWECSAERATVRIGPVATTRVMPQASTHPAEVSHSGAKHGR